MDNSERLVEHYLRSLGYLDIVYEPDGNVPPDFLVNRHIAVEVRRLNQNVRSVTGDLEGIEEVFVPLWQAMKRYLPTLGPSTPRRVLVRQHRYASPSGTLAHA